MENRLVAIFTVWSDTRELTDKAIANILPVVDFVLVVYSNTSNYNQFIKFRPGESHDKVGYINWEPIYGVDVHQNETAKRNYGLNIAKQSGFTHFIICDGDEFYKQGELQRDKERVISKGLNGVVHPIKVLFGKPTLCVNDHTLVPGIHRLDAVTDCGSYTSYPFAKDAQGHYHIDPTRRLNYITGIEMSDTIMWHASWIRSDVNLKIRNSAAKNNLLKSTIFEDLEHAAPGYYCKFYRDTIVEVENIFGL